ncbi:MAG: class II SORL domain-containing protein [Planctomycetota bacterium]|jgi:superoxide reductase
MPWEKLFAGVNRPADPDNPTDLEKKHIPVIAAPESVKAGECFEVVVEVGKLLAHPNENGHFIEFVELYADDRYLARADLTAGTTCPRLRLCVALRGPVDELRAYGRCNLHGVWVSAVKVAVKE